MQQHTSTGLATARHPAMAVSPRIVGKRRPGLRCEDETRYTGLYKMWWKIGLGKTGMNELNEAGMNALISQLLYIHCARILLLWMAKMNRSTKLVSIQTSAPSISASSTRHAGHLHRTHSSSGSWAGTVILRWVHCVTHPGQYIEMCSSLLKPTLLGCLICLSVTYTGLKTSEVHESVPGHSQVIRVGTQHWLYGE